MGRQRERLRSSSLNPRPSRPIPPPIGGRLPRRTEKNVADIEQIGRPTVLIATACALESWCAASSGQLRKPLTGTCARHMVALTTWEYVERLSRGSSAGKSCIQCRRDMGHVASGNEHEREQAPSIGEASDRASPGGSSSPAGPGCRRLRRWLERRSSGKQSAGTFTFTGTGPGSGAGARTRTGTRTRTCASALGR